MVIDPDGVGITQRTVPTLALLSARPRPGYLAVRAPGRPDLEIAEPVDGPKEFVRVFRSKPQVPARLAPATEWFSEFLGRPARLAWLGDPTARPIATHARERPGQLRRRLPAAAHQRGSPCGRSDSTGGFRTACSSA
jgi:hypothetical protein